MSGEVYSNQEESTLIMPGDDLVDIYLQALYRYKYCGDLHKNEETADEDEQEFEVIMPNSELGKYLDSSGMSGYLSDNLGMLPHTVRTEDESKDEDNSVAPIQGRRAQRGTTYGFICGKQCSDFNTVDLQASIKYEYGIFDKLKMAIQCVGVLLSRIMNGFRAMTHFLPWKPQGSSLPLNSTNSNIGPAKNVSHKFTTEYRLMQNSRVLAQRATVLGDTFKEIGAASLALAHMQIKDRLHDNYKQRQHAAILKVFVLKKSIDDQMRTLENLLVIENRLIDRLEVNLLPNYFIMGCKKTKRVKVEVESSNNSSMLLETDVELSATDANVFESDVRIDQQNLDLYSYTSHDEIFEAVVDPHDEHEMEETAGPSATQREENIELIAIQDAVMNQLRSSLLPRRTDMRQREKEAYIKCYGKEPEDDVDEVLPVDNVQGDHVPRETATSHLLNSSSSSSFEMVTREDEFGEESSEKESGRYNAVEESYVFGDQDSDDEDKTTLKSEFRASLEAALRKRGAGGDC